jgi:hypothetical protein
MGVMRNVIPLAVLFAALPAAAQSIPEDSPGTCQVTIARAPDEVRKVVEAWVRSEAQCSVALEVRIVPTEGGFYLLAQDERGRIRERIVPDAQTAGVLVASWIADDNAPAPAGAPVAAGSPAGPMLPPAAAPAVVAPVPASSESITPPGMAPLVLGQPASAAPAPRSKWLSFGLLAPMTESSGPGVRGELDVWRRRVWTIGVAASFSEAAMPLWSPSGAGQLTTGDFKAMAYLGRTSTFGRWQLQPSVGLGLVYSQGQGLIYSESGSFQVDGTFPSAEGSLMLSREIGKSWAAYGGPLATLISQRFEALSTSSSYPMTIAREDVDVVLLAGVRRRL